MEKQTECVTPEWVDDVTAPPRGTAVTLCLSLSPEAVCSVRRPAPGGVALEAPVCLQGNVGVCVCGAQQAALSEAALLEPSRPPNVKASLPVRHISSSPPPFIFTVNDGGKLPVTSCMFRHRRHTGDRSTGGSTPPPRVTFATRSHTLTCLFCHRSPFPF